MLTFVPSKDTETIAMEFEGTATKEDAVKINKIIEGKFADKGKFNIYAIINGTEESAFTGFGESMQVNMEAWNQFHKFAVISPTYFSGQMAEVEKMLPKLKIKHFQMEEMNEAWEWILE